MGSEMCIRDSSMAYRMCLVAGGQADATVAFTPKSDWDVAAASLIATESGAIVSDIRGQLPHFDTEVTSRLGVICAGPRLHALLVKRIKPHLAQFKRGRDFKFLGTRMADRKTTEGETPTQLLHLVIGGELVDPIKTEFKDLTAVSYTHLTLPTILLV